MSALEYEAANDGAPGGTVTRSCTGQMGPIRTPVDEDLRQGALGTQVCSLVKRNA
jgi:hypothetical protein